MTGSGLLLVVLVLASVVDMNNACSCLIYSLEHSICTGQFGKLAYIYVHSGVGKTEMCSPFGYK